MTFISNKNTKLERPWNSICPNCNDCRAYKGLNIIECPVHTCKHYTAKQEKLVRDYKDKIEKELSAHIPNEYEQPANKDADDFDLDQAFYNYNCFGFAP